MKMPEPTMPPITSMVASNRPSFRSKPGLALGELFVIAGSITTSAQRMSRLFSFSQGHFGRQLSRPSPLWHSTLKTKKIICQLLSNTLTEPAAAAECPSHIFADPHTQQGHHRLWPATRSAGASQYHSLKLPRS